MEDHAYLASIAASIFYLIAAARLFRLHRRTRELPELLLSMFFLFSGVYYFSYNFPSLIGFDGWSSNADSVVNWTYLVGEFFYLFFVRVLFRPKSTWAFGLVVFCSALLVVGGSFGNGDYDADSFRSPMFWAEWLGYTLPCVWMLCEAVISRKSAAKRLRIELCPPTVANRYLLLAVVASFQILACLADVSFAYEISNDQAVSMFSDVLLGISEMASIAVLWLAFFPPKFYTDWIYRKAAILPTPVEG